MAGYFGPGGSASHHSTPRESIGPETSTLSAGDSLLVRQITAEHVCKDCRCAFPNQTALVQHGKDSGHKPFHCVCNTKFDRPDSLKRHSAICSKVGGATPKIDCPLCDIHSGSKGFTRRDHLVQHLRVRHKLDNKGLAFMKPHLDGGMKTTDDVPPNPAGTAATAHPLTVPVPEFDAGLWTDFGYGAPLAATNSPFQFATEPPVNLSQTPGFGTQPTPMPMNPYPFFNGDSMDPVANQGSNSMYFTSMQAGILLPDAGNDVADIVQQDYTPALDE